LVVPTISEMEVVALSELELPAMVIG